MDDCAQREHSSLWYGGHDEQHTNDAIEPRGATKPWAGGWMLIFGNCPDGRSYFSFASFRDPDRSGWLLQEVKPRLPGRHYTVAREGGRTPGDAAADAARNVERQRDRISGYMS